MHRERFMHHKIHRQGTGFKIPNLALSIAVARGSDVPNFASEDVATDASPHRPPITRLWPYIGLALALVASLGFATVTSHGRPQRNTAPLLAAQGAESSKPAYVIFTRERTRDASELRTYSQKSPASLAGHPVTALAVYGRHEVLEGAQVEGVVVIRFPSFAAAKTWYDSPAYREARKHRFAGADYRAVIVEGV
jgi:uncharacterized protein (DUF1330 family)